MLPFLKLIINYYGFIRTSLLPCSFSWWLASRLTPSSSDQRLSQHSWRASHPNLLSFPVHDLTQFWALLLNALQKDGFKVNWHVQRFRNNFEGEWAQHHFFSCSFVCLKVSGHLGQKWVPQSWPSLGNQAHSERNNDTRTCWCVY